MTTAPPDDPVSRVDADTETIAAVPTDPSTGDAPAPSVVAVVVTRNPGAFLEEAMAGLGAQDYPALSVLVVDAGSAHDPTARVAAALPTAFVRRLSGDPGFGGAANEALSAVQGATFFVICHDDVVLDPSAIRVMVEEAFRSNAAIVGPKLVSFDQPDVLLEVGRAIDRLGGSHTGIEPGEVDQEQHDGVRDVFYVSSAAMLVRADLFNELGGFDPDTFPGSEDLDLCWRARLAGARVMVAPDARGRHGEAAQQRATQDSPSAREVARCRVRVVFTAYSAGTLRRLVPLGLVVTLLEALVLIPTRRRGDAFAAARAWWWNLAHFGRLRNARRRAQSMRRVQDGELRELQVGASARLGVFLSHHHADERMQSLSERGRDFLDAAGELFRHPASAIMGVFFVLVIAGSRGLLSHGVPAIGTFARWPGVGDLVGELTSAWRHTGLGSTTAAPPVLGMMAGLGTVLLGAVGLAQTLVVVGAFVLGALGAFRLVRGMGGAHGAAGVAALAYGISAVPRNAVAGGRLGPLVLYALLPHIVLLVARAGRFPGLIGTGRRSLLGLVIVTAIAGAWYPPSLVVGVVVAVTLVIAGLFAGGAGAGFRCVGAALAGFGGALVLLMPWSAQLVDARTDRAMAGLSFRPQLDLVHVVTLRTGPNGAGIASWALVVAAAAALLLASGPALAWVTRSWVLAVAGYAAVYLPARLAPHTAVAAPEAGLALAALGLAIAAGFAVGALGDLLARARFSLRHAVGYVAVAGIIVASFGFLGDVFDGRWRSSVGWTDTVAFSQDRLSQGEFRILWLGDSSVLPLEPVQIDQTLSYTLTRNGPGDARALLRAKASSADRVISRAVRVAIAGDTSRLGRMLAPAGRALCRDRVAQRPQRRARTGAAGRGERDLGAARPGPARQSARAGALREPVVGAGSGGRAAPEHSLRRCRSVAQRNRHQPFRRDATAWCAHSCWYRTPRRGVRRGMECHDRWHRASSHTRVRIHERMDCGVARFGCDRARWPNEALSAGAARGRALGRRHRLVGARPTPKHPSACAAGPRARARGAHSRPDARRFLRRCLRRRLLDAPVNRRSPETATSSEGQTARGQTARVFRAPVLVLIAAVVAGAVLLDSSASSIAVPRAPRTGAVDGPTIPPAHAVSVAWYCSEGTSTTDGRADETIIVGNLAHHPIHVTLTVMTGADKTPTSVERRVDTLARARFHVADIVADPEPGVVVEVRDGQAIVEHELHGNNDVAVGPCAREPSRNWYFAAGTTVRGAQEWLTLFNPFGDDAIVDITFLTESGYEAPGSTHSLVVARRTRVSLAVHDQVQRRDRVAIAVHALVGRVIAERTLLFDGTDARRGLAVSMGVTGPANRWRVVTGDAQSGSAESLSIANFDITPTKVEVDVLLDGDAVLAPQSVDVPARGVVRVDLATLVPVGAGYAVDVRVTRAAPVVVEAFGAWASPSPVTGVATTMGSVTPAKRWALAIGRINDGDDALIAALNVSGRPITVQLYAYTGGDANSPKSAPAIALPPNERAVFRLSEHDIRPDQVLVIAADGPIIVGREILGGGVSLSAAVPFRGS